MGIETLTCEQMGTMTGYMHVDLLRPATVTSQLWVGGAPSVSDP